MVDKCRARVAEQAQLLDSVKEDWWWPTSIDVDTLDQADWSNCVLGQNWGDFASGMNAIFDGERPPCSGIGFSGGHYDYTDQAYQWKADEETEAWKEQIQVRRETWPVAVDQSTSSANAFMDQVLTPVPTEPDLWVVNQSEYSKILLSDGRYVIVPSEWLDTATVSAISSGRKVVEWNFEWESRS